MLCNITRPFRALSKLVDQLHRLRHVMQHHTNFLCTFPIGKAAKQRHVMQHHTNFLRTFPIGKAAKQRHVMQHHTNFLRTFPIGKSAEEAHSHACVITQHHATSSHLSAHFPTGKSLNGDGSSHTHTHTCHDLSVYFPYG